MTVPKCPLFGDSTYHYMSECQVYTKPASPLRGCSHSACTGSWSAIGVFVCTDRSAIGVFVCTGSWSAIGVFVCTGRSAIGVFVCTGRLARCVCVHRPVG